MEPPSCCTGWSTTRRLSRTSRRGRDTNARRPYLERCLPLGRRAREYRSPQGHPLRREWRAFNKPRTHVTKADTIIYFDREHPTAGVARFSRCCPQRKFVTDRFRELIRLSKPPSSIGADAIPMSTTPSAPSAQSGSRPSVFSPAALGHQAGGEELPAAAIEVRSLHGGVQP